MPLALLGLLGGVSVFVTAWMAVVDDNWPAALAFAALVLVCVLLADVLEASPDGDVGDTPPWSADEADPDRDTISLN